MARIRMIQPSFWTSDDIARLSLQARLLYVGLWSLADDDGRFRDSLPLIRSAVFPLDENLEKHEVAAWYEELITAGLVVRYTVDGRGYCHIPTFRRHQKPKYATQSKLPAPPDSGGTSPESGELSPQLGENVPESGETSAESGEVSQKSPDEFGFEFGLGLGQNREQLPPLAVTGESPAAEAETLPLALEEPTASARSVPAKRPRSAATPAEGAQYPALDRAHCDALYERWRVRMGAVAYAKFRRAFGAQYQSAHQLAAIGQAVPTFAQLDDAFEAALALADRGPSTSFLTPERVAGFLLPLARRRAEISDPERRLEATFAIVHGREIPKLRRAS